jgi:glycosyltransferase involved in cell wall biosynthesis
MLITARMEEFGQRRKNLVFLTGEFPFGNGETFIEIELPFHTRVFEKIFILVPAGHTNKPQRATPQNVTTIPIEQNHQWIQRITALANFSFWQALLLDFVRKKRATGLINIFLNCWHYYTHALQIKKAVRFLINQHKLKPAETILYSYWLDEKSLGIALVKKKIPAIKAISRAHGWDVYEERHQPPFLPFRPWLFKTLDKVAVVSKKGAEYLIEKFEPQEGKVVVSYLGTEGLNENRKTNHSTSLRARNGKYLIVSCSSLIPLKRVDLIIEALSFLDRPVRWIHFGDGPLRDNLETMAAKLLGKKNIDYHFTGQLTNNHVRDFYETNHIDIFISTSETEGLPVSMMEAQSAGIPILGTNVGGVNEILFEGVTGWLLNPNPSAAEISEKIKWIWQIKESFIDKVRRNSKENYRRKFDAKNNYQQFIRKILLD